MHIKKMTLENFRCFEHLEIEFPQDYAVLIGTNGAGKSSILDALSIGTSVFLMGTGISMIHFHESDIRSFTYTHRGGGFHREDRYPVRVFVRAETEDHDFFEWEREKKSPNGRVSARESGPINHFDRDPRAIDKENDLLRPLPLLVCYGTDRLWLPKKKRKDPSTGNTPTRFDGYADALVAATNEELIQQRFRQYALVEVQNMKSLPIFQAIKSAMERLYREMDDGLEEVRVAYDFKTWEIEIHVKHKNEEFVSRPLRYLSDGIKSMLSITADIACRMALLNPHLGEHVIAATTGIVLIDEIDMHLHPSWQRKILASLKKVFPRIQFIVTTHAPAVLANVPRENIIVFSEGKAYPPAEHTYGRDVNTILRDVMGTEVRPQEVMEKKDLFYKALDEGDFTAAEKQLGILEKILGQSDEEVVYMTTMLDLER